MPRRHGWVKPLLKIVCYYAAGDYPLTIMINFQNGTTRRYRDDELHQPASGNYFQPFLKPVDGYKFRGEQKRSRIHGWSRKMRQGK